MSITAEIPTFAATGGGAHRDPFDPKDHYYDPAPISLPSTKDLRKDGNTGVTPIYNQYDTGSCTANAASAAFWFEQIMGRHQADWGTDGPSRLFIYWVARSLFNRKDDVGFTTAQDGGSCMRDAMKGIAMRGACPEGICKFPNFDDIYAKVSAQGLRHGQGVSDEDNAKWTAAVKSLVDPIVNAKPSDNVYKAASSHTITNYYRIDIDRPYASDPEVTLEQKEQSGRDCLRKVKQCLNEGFPVAFSYWYYLPGNELYELADAKYNSKDAHGNEIRMYAIKDIWKGENSTSRGRFPRHTWVEDLPSNFRFPDNLGGHSVLIVGYDEEYFFIQNSWGSDWSNGGVFLMPHSWISDFAATNDFWTVRVDPVKAATPTAPVHWEEVQNKAFSG